MHIHKASGTFILLMTGIVPILAVTGSYLININHTDVSSCNPLLSGCVSISRAARSGPGLLFFKALALPGAAIMAVSWLFIARRITELKLATSRMTHVVLWVGVTGAAFMALYIINLGLDGSFYRFMRRFGVIIFFGFVAINQLLVVRIFWSAKTRLPVAAHKPIYWLTGLVCMDWLVGVGSTGKHLVIKNPERLAQVENIIEWWFALLLTIAFMLLARVLSTMNSADE